MDKEPITISGLEKLKKELENLKNKDRPKIVAAISEARSHGDLKENAEYHAAKEQQAKLEGRILSINDTKIKLEKKEWIMSELSTYKNIQVKNFYANKKINWKVVH